MSEKQLPEHEAIISARNVGGIDETTVSLEPGVNVLAGRNATNRTSFLQALIGALGGDDVSIKGDAETAEMRLELDGKQYSRRLQRRANGDSTSGDPYLDDAELAELFAFLLESNEARRAVATGQDLRDLIMRPVDTDAIKRDISELEADKDRIDEEIAAVEQRKRDLPELEAEAERLTDEIESLRETLAEKEAEIEAADADIQTQRAEQERLEEKLEALRSARNDLEDVRYDIDTERESIQSLEQTRTTLERELSELPETPQETRSHLETRIETLREQRRELDNDITSLQNTIQFNEEMFEEGGADADIGDDEAVTAQLLADSTVVCWTCGSEVEHEQIEQTLDHLRDRRQQKVAEKREIGDDLDDLKADKQALDQQHERRTEYRADLSRVETEIDQRESNLETLKERRSELEARVQSLEDEIESLESGQFDEILDLHREANEIEYELGRLEGDREAVEEEIQAVEQRIDELSDFEAERERVTEELTALRTRVETLEREAVDAFNEHMADVLGTLDYDNLERIWIERVQREVREGRRKAIETVFELHVVRSTPSGESYEDTVAHLSESEREVTGLVFALAGYLVHEVYEEVPFILLDSLEAIDSARIAELVRYFETFPDFLVVALLEEDADALGGECNRVESI